MKTIWKFSVMVGGEGVDGTFGVIMPKGARFLSVQLQHGLPVMWFLADPSAEKAPRKFAVHGTGHEVPKNRAYLGTFQLYNGDFIGHLFEVE